MFDFYLYYCLVCALMLSDSVRGMYQIKIRINYFSDVNCIFQLLSTFKTYYKPRSNMITMVNKNRLIIRRICIIVYVVRKNIRVFRRKKVEVLRVKHYCKIVYSWNKITCVENLVPVKMMSQALLYGKLSIVDQHKQMILKFVIPFQFSQWSILRFICPFLN